MEHESDQEWDFPRNRVNGIQSPDGKAIDVLRTAERELYTKTGHPPSDATDWFVKSGLASTVHYESKPDFVGPPSPVTQLCQKLDIGVPRLFSVKDPEPYCA